MRILMVSPYPPIRDGIAAYAVQSVAALRRQGHEVEVLSPGPSAAHHHLDLHGPRGPLVLARRVRGYDKVVIQFHPDIFYPHPATPARHAAVSLALLAAVRAARRTEVVVHEIDYSTGRRRGPDGVAARRLWRRVQSIQLHTEMERRNMIEAFGVRPERTTVTAHGAHFIRRTSMTRDAARRSLGIPDDELVFLAIGAQLHNQYVSDEQFDRWLVASDVVVLPYRNIWSSGVLERALLYDRKVIATAVGGLSHQAAARPGVTLVDDAGLAGAMWRARGQAGLGPDPAEAAWPTGPERLRERVQEQVVARATRRRGLPVRTGNGQAAAVAGQGSLPLRRLPPLGLPPATSARPGVSLLKRLVRRATGWQVDPLVAQVNALREVTIQALERTAQLEREAAAGRDRDRDPG
jgi:hypothetical protein